MIPSMIRAARDGDLEEINRLLAADGVDVDVRMPPSNYRETRIRAGQTPLMLAAQEGHPDVIRRLLEAGADVNAVGYNNSTALHQLVFNNAMRDDLTDEDIIGSINALLMAPGININIRTGTGISVFEAALMNKSIAVCELLMNAGADINEINPEGQTPLESLILHIRSEMDVVNNVNENDPIFNDFNNDDREDIKQMKSKGLWLLSKGGRVSPGKEYLYKTIAGNTAAEKERFHKALQNSVWARRKNAVAAWHIKISKNKNGGSRRRRNTFKKRKASTRRQPRKHRY